MPPYFDIRYPPKQPQASTSFPKFLHKYWLVTVLFGFVAYFMIGFPMRPFQGKTIWLPFLLASLQLSIFYFGLDRKKIPCETFESNIIVFEVQGLLLLLIAHLSWIAQPDSWISKNESWVIPFVVVLISGLTLAMILACFSYAAGMGLRNNISVNQMTYERYLRKGWRTPQLKLWKIVVAGLGILSLGIIAPPDMTSLLGQSIIGIALILTLVLWGFFPMEKHYEPFRVFIVQVTSGLPLAITGFVMAIAIARLAESPYIEIIIESYSDWWVNKFFVVVLVAYCTSFFYLYWATRFSTYLSLYFQGKVKWVLNYLCSIWIFLFLFFVPSVHLSKFIGILPDSFTKQFSFPQKAQVNATTYAREADSDKSEGRQIKLVDLNGLLKKSDGTDPDPVILIAASGGGSRAALYTYSVLRGLKDIEQLDNILLLSGVSGGAAAVSYFAGNSERLKDPTKTDTWMNFQSAMAQPIIQDVLDGLMEWKYVNGKSQEIHRDMPCSFWPVVVKGWNVFGDIPQNCYGYRMGEYLERSLTTYLSMEPWEDLEVKQVATNRLGRKDRNLGLIFNTSVVGCFPKNNCTDPKYVWESPDLPAACQGQAKLKLPECENAYPEEQTSEVAGGRLILTNLKVNRKEWGFPQKGLEYASELFFPYFIVQDPGIPLTQAASLSGNFPGFFSNAAVDVNDRLRYWVTDGGATDNRGAVSLLYALLDALPETKEEVEKLQVSYPHIHVIIADASAVNDEYSEDRGISVPIASPTKFASQLIIELKKEIEGILGEEKFHLHYLTMPKVLRSHGGISTHWMIGENMKFEKPSLPKPLPDCQESEKECTLSRNEVLQILENLHSEFQTLPSTKNVETLKIWICNEQNGMTKNYGHKEAWGEIVRALIGKPYEPTFCQGKSR